MKSCIQILVVLLTLAAISLPVSAVEPVYRDDSGKAIRGYDPVAYFTDSRARKGVDAFSYAWQGANWYFSSAENQRAFIADPEKYAPQYGGYCSWAVSRGYTAPIDPKAWHIRDDRLYLNFSKSVQRNWKKDIPGNIAAGNSNWPGLLSHSDQ